jgi:hypothetical protein
MALADSRIRAVNLNMSPNKLQDTSWITASSKKYVGGEVGSETAPHKLST